MRCRQALKDTEKDRTCIDNLLPIRITACQLVAMQILPLPTCTKL